jgi:hypothetical protein
MHFQAGVNVKLMKFGQLPCFFLWFTGVGYFMILCQRRFNVEGHDDE